MKDARLRDGEFRGMPRGLARSANVLTIGPGAPFLPTFANALLDGRVINGLSRKSGPLALARATIYVPTRRSKRALIAAFAKASNGAILLPRIAALGALEESDSFAGDEAFPGSLGAAILPAIGDRERRLALTDLVLGWTRALRTAIVSVGDDGVIKTHDEDAMAVGTSPADAYALAGNLGTLIDEFIIEGIDWRRLHGLVEIEHDSHWRITTRFLEIAFETWPKMLEERGAIDGAERRVRLLAAETRSLSKDGAKDPVIVLGSTGTNEATAQLMAAICRLANGAVVLPGLDKQTSDRAFDLSAQSCSDSDEPVFGHPQSALKRLLGILDVDRDDVAVLEDALPSPRARFVSEALQPAGSTSEWFRFRSDPRALDRVCLIEGGDEREESLAIAIRLREALNTPHMTAALITPDRNLARRVRAELARWSIEIDDSGGAPLAATRAGTVARLAAAAAQPDRKDLDLVALLAHPLAHFGIGRDRVAHLASLLEIAVFRASCTSASPLRPRIADARKAAVKDRHANPYALRVRDADWAGLGELADAIDLALSPLVGMPGSASLAQWIAAHRNALARVCGESLPGEDGEALDDLFADPALQEPHSFSLDRMEYIAFFDTLAGETQSRVPGKAHPRVKILGLLEARLIDADLLILGGLDETIWPPAPQSDPFLNRPMRAALGLTPPERRIGQTAHDFWMAMGAPDVVLTRALKRGGSPTVPSRFLQRMEALAGDAFKDVRARGTKYLGLAQAVDRPEVETRLAPPQPRPPVVLRPQRLSVTAIETWIRDPYSIYARHILKLQPLDPLDAEPGASEQGTAIHEAIAKFIGEFSTGELPLHVRGRLIEIADAELAVFHEDPAWLTFRRPRVLDGLDVFLDYEASRRPRLTAIFAEAKGKLVIPLTDGSSFTLSGEADRIEIDHDGNIRVVDYKTGTPPSAKEIKLNLAPQLTLEAAMIAEGAFENIPSREVSDALYLKLGKDGKPIPLNFDGEDFPSVVKRHRALFKELLEAFRDASMPYLSRPRAKYASRFSDYDHLARVKEWSATSGASAGEGDLP